MSFSDKLLSWYADNARTLPWRGIDNPYFIWLSEIILQQTRIDQGRDYYLRFISQYPTVAHLAAASEDQVLKLWQGLGYYSRARNLLAAARQIMSQFNGIFPSSYHDILSLKGVGPYTAAAIASFAFRLPYPVIDGNVFRFISRLYGIDTPIPSPAAYRQIQSLLSQLIDRHRPDLFNQAIMDFGSVFCHPSNSKADLSIGSIDNCSLCPFAAECVAFRTGKVSLFPVKAVPIPVQTRYFFYVDLHWSVDGIPYTCVHQRQTDDIWRGLYEFPLFESPQPLSDSDAHTLVLDFASQLCAIPLTSASFSVPVVHKLTHRTIIARFVSISLPHPPSISCESMRLLPASHLASLPVPRLIDRYLAHR